MIILGRCHRRLLGALLAWSAVVVPCAAAAEPTTELRVEGGRKGLIIELGDAADRPARAGAAEGSRARAYRGARKLILAEASYPLSAKQLDLFAAHAVVSAAKRNIAQGVTPTISSLYAAALEGMVSALKVRGDRYARIEPRPRQATRRGEASPAVVTAHRLPDDLGYVRIRQFERGTARRFELAVGALRSRGSLRGLVLDLRGNPGGLVEEAEWVACQLLPGGTALFTRRIGPVGRPRRSIEQQTDPAGAALFPLEVPITVLVDDQTASASELLAGALKDAGRATLIGTRTYGKALVQTRYPLPDGSKLWFTTAELRLMRSPRHHGRGIAPQIALDSSRRRSVDRAIVRARGEAETRSRTLRTAIARLRQPR